MSKIKIYTMPGCPWCAKAKDFLSEKGIDFDDIDVEADEQAREEMIKNSGARGVPQIEVNGKLIVGFDKEALEKELENLEDTGKEEKEEK